MGVTCFLPPAIRVTMRSTTSMSYSCWKPITMFTNWLDVIRRAGPFWRLYL
uniref:IP07983p n=1 Tax=Drosophila melanogaster TaxID=7227 RepID=Q4V647_DROME|nr:IP07983p [Drosophila melanogaster]